MARTLLAALALIVAGTASAQTASVVVAQTDEGFALTAPTDAPLDSDAVVLSKTADGWHLLAPRGGESGRRGAARVGEIRAALDAHREHRGRRRAVQMSPALQAALAAAAPEEDTSASRVKYSVWLSPVPASDVASLLTNVEDEAPFAQATVETRDGRAEIELTFFFASVADWSAWTERVRLGERFAADPSVRQRTRIEVVRPQTRRPEAGAEEILDVD